MNFIAFFMCPVCTHLDQRPDKWCCDAYPDGIPDDIIKEGFDHRFPHPGDNEIRFHPRDTAAKEAVDTIYGKMPEMFDKFNFRKPCSRGSHRHIDYNNGQCHPRKQWHGHPGRRKISDYTQPDKEIAWWLLKTMYWKWVEYSEKGELEKDIKPPFNMPEEIAAKEDGWEKPDFYDFQKKKLWDALCEMYHKEDWKVIDKQIAKALDMMSTLEEINKKQCQPGMHWHQDYGGGKCHPTRQKHRAGIGGPDHDEKTMAMGRENVLIDPSAPSDINTKNLTTLLDEGVGADTRVSTDAKRAIKEVSRILSRLSDSAYPTDINTIQYSWMWVEKIANKLASGEWTRKDVYQDYLKVITNLPEIGGFLSEDIHDVINAIETHFFLSENTGISEAGLDMEAKLSEMDRTLKAMTHDLPEYAPQDPEYWEHVLCANMNTLMVKTHRGDGRYKKASEMGWLDFQSIVNSKHGEVIYSLNDKGLEIIKKHQPEKYKIFNEGMDAILDMCFMDTDGGLLQGWDVKASRFDSSSKYLCAESAAYHLADTMGVSDYIGEERGTSSLFTDRALERGLLSFTDVSEKYNADMGFSEYLGRLLYERISEKYGFDGDPANAPKNLKSGRHYSIGHIREDDEDHYLVLETLLRDNEGTVVWGFDNGKPALYVKGSALFEMSSLLRNSHVKSMNKTDAVFEGAPEAGEITTQALRGETSDRKTFGNLICKMPILVDEGDADCEMFAKSFMSTMVSNLPVAFNHIASSIMIAPIHVLNANGINPGNYAGIYMPALDKIGLPIEEQGIDDLKKALLYMQEAVAVPGEDAKSVLTMCAYACARDAMATPFHELVHALDEFTSKMNEAPEGTYPELEPVRKLFNALKLTVDEDMNQLSAVQEYSGNEAWRASKSRYTQEVEQTACIMETYLSHPHEFARSPRLVNLYYQIRDAFGGWESPIMSKREREILYGQLEAVVKNG